MSVKINMVSSQLLGLIVEIFVLVQSESFLNVEELSALKYGMTITNRPVLIRKEPAENELYISSKHGQPYSCLLPIVPSILNEDDEIVKDGSDIINLIDKSMNDTCLTFHKGWWTYKLCHKKKVEQYHLNDIGKIDGKVTLLGLYSSEDDWAIKDKSGMKSGTLYHNQIYINGSDCDLTKSPRKTTVQYYCSTGGSNQILHVEEPATCEYVLSVHVKSLCSHVLFKEKENANEIALICSPALQQHEYDKYMQKREVKKEKKKIIEDPDNVETEEEQGDKSKIFNEAASQVNKLMKGVFNLFGGGSKGNLQFTDLKLKTKNGKMTNLLSLDDDVDVDKKNSKSNDKIKFHKTEDKKGVKKFSFKISDILSEDDADDDTPAKDQENLRKTSKDDIADEIVQLENENKKLVGETEKFRDLMNKQYKIVEDSAKKELKQSEELLRELEKSYDNAKNDKERDEISNKIEETEDYIEKFQNQIKDIEKGIKGISTMENKAQKKLKEIDNEINTQKVLKHLNTKMSEWKEEETSSVNKRMKKINIEKFFKDVTKGDENDDVDSKENKKKGKYDLENFVNLFQENVKVDGDKNDDDNENANDDLNIEKDSKVQWKDNMKVRVRSADKDEDIDKEAGDLGEDVKEATKKMEANVKKQLKDAGLDFGENIKIKIITSKDQFDKFNKGSKDGKILTDNDASKFKDLLLGFLGGGTEKKEEEKRQQSLEENYNFKWGDGDDVTDFDNSFNDEINNKDSDDNSNDDENISSS